MSGCFLTNIRVDECGADSECSSAFGIGSACVDGYCSEPTSCVTGNDCRRVHGGGACVEGHCVDTLPPDPDGACTLLEPEGLSTTKLIGPDAPHLVGGMFLFEVDFSPPIIDAARLAVRDINGAGGLGKSRSLAMVIATTAGRRTCWRGPSATRASTTWWTTSPGRWACRTSSGRSPPATPSPRSSTRCRRTTRRCSSRRRRLSPALTGEPDRLNEKTSTACSGAPRRATTCRVKCSRPRSPACIRVPGPSPRSWPRIATMPMGSVWPTPSR